MQLQQTPPADCFSFAVDDLNFIGYTQGQLTLICKHNIPLRTRFPKLVVVLAQHPFLSQWLQEHSLVLDEARLVDSVVRCVDNFAFNFQGNLVTDKVDLSKDEFWGGVVDFFLMNNQNKPRVEEKQSHGSDKFPTKTKRPFSRKKEKSVWI